LEGIGETILIFIRWFIGTLFKKHEKTFYIPASSGPNRHERRMEAKRSRIVYALKGRSGFKIIRRMFRKYGAEEVAKLMRGTYRLRGKDIAKTAFYRAMNKTVRKGA